MPDHRATQLGTGVAGCPLACIAADDSPPDTPGHRAEDGTGWKTNSHIVHLPKSKSGLDTPCIPHLAPPSCNVRSRCGMGVGGRCRCVFSEDECWFGVWVLDGYFCQK